MAWTVTLGDYNDLNNHYTFSNDGGRTWMPPRELPFTGQTMSPLFLGEGRFLVVYNYRRAPQGIHLAMIHLNEDRCKVDFDEILWRPSKNVPGGKKKGVDSFDEFQFGLPSLFRLGETSFLLLFWHYWDHAFGIRCLKLEIEL